MMKKFAIPILALAFFILQTQAAFACGGLVAPNGAVRLSRATTFVAWHNGIERYLTTFTYQGDVTNLGCIVPLPAVPLKIEEGGAWTLQRLNLEAHPFNQFRLLHSAAAQTANSAQVLEQVQIAAPTITMMRGSRLAV